MLQILGRHWPNKHWVLKSPRHLAGLAGLLAVFPEARIVQLHRDPVEVLPSVCSLCEIDRSVFATAPDRMIIGEFWMERLVSGLATAMAIRGKDSPERYLDIRYQELIIDPIATVKQIYSTHGYEYSSTFEKAMKQCLQQNRQNKYGKHDYRLEDYGLDRDTINASFADYRTQFGV